MEVISALVGIIVAAAAGFYFGRNISGDVKEKNRLEAELNAKEQELEAFKNKVSNHFEKTADLFNQVSDSYQSLYDHMAKSSSQLCATPTFQSLPKSAYSSIEAATTAVHKTNTDSENMFDATKLYNAHDYRNQQEIDEQAKKDQQSKSDKVVDIETAKEDKNEPALDYAIKDKGVVNHNSLDVDGVKKSKS